MERKSESEEEIAPEEYHDNYWKDKLREHPLYPAAREWAEIELRKKNGQKAK